MDYEPIKKAQIDQMRVKPNLANYQETARNFSWWRMYQELDWLPGGGLNKAYEAIDRHVVKGNGARLAMVWEGKNGEEEKYTYADLKTHTDKFANVVTNLGLKKGDRVFIFMDRIPELYFALFGVLKAGGIVGPLFSAFGPDPVRDRLVDAGATILITTPELKRRIARILPDCPDLQHIVIVNKNNRDAKPLEGNDHSYERLMASAPAQFKIVNTSQCDYSIMHYTSGTTGKPKGAVHRHQAVVQQYATGKWALDMHPGDIYWCTADPGWVTGTSYGMLAPWTNGVTQVIYEGGLSARRWYQIIEKHRVNIWYTAPTAIRMLMRAGDEPLKGIDFSSLRFISSVGEPLNPEAIVWGMRVFKQGIHDNWWQTETGAILCANYASMEIRPGSMGRPIPGIAMGILDDKYNEVPPGTPGLLAVRPDWPAMFHNYWRNTEMYNSKFKKGWYITGDRAAMDADGYFWFEGRADDVINTAGHLVGPFEVESALIEHPAVAEAGVIGKPDPIAMEVVKAFVALKPGYEGTPELRAELM
ncbi:MAG: acetate--CoA ligase, partial [Chloroflexi bacterium]|nr:acetate--CoA ligase [Chloroflexota bacterium]